MANSAVRASALACHSASMGFMPAMISLRVVGAVMGFSF
jgi:hypothetical protein